MTPKAAGITEKTLKDVGFRHSTKYRGLVLAIFPDSTLKVLAQEEDVDPSGAMRWAVSLIQDRRLVFLGYVKEFNQLNDLVMALRAL